MATILKYYDSLDGIWKPFVNNANDSVTLTGDQTISGIKTFTQPIVVPDSSIPAQKLDFTTFPKFSAYRAVDQTVANGDTIIFTSEDYDVGSGFNTTTGVFTAPQTGTYSFSWKLQTSTATSILSGINYGPANIVKRGSWNGQGPYISSEGSADIYLQAGQTANVVIIDVQGTTKSVNGTQAACYFMGRLLP